jgi:hypothetical protein
LGQLTIILKKYKNNILFTKYDRICVNANPKNKYFFNIMYGYVITGLIVLVVLAAAIIAYIKFYRKEENLGTYTIQDIQASPACFTDDQCGPNQFCYLGHCWGYWNYNPMPWNNCSISDNPYYKLVPASILNDNQCESPYCKSLTTRGPGGVISNECYPVCGEACSSNEDCPAGCPQCYKGTCQPPFDPNF